MNITEYNIDVLEGDSSKKSFLIRDILQSNPMESLHNSITFDNSELSPNNRLISWILQNRTQNSYPILEQTNENQDSEQDSLIPILHEMSKSKSF